MPPISTYVFFDFGTNGLLNENPNITEVHMSAVKCQELRRYFNDGGEQEFAKEPYVSELHCRLENNVMWFLGDEHRDPEECVLEDEIASFLDDLDKPLCLIAYNGPKFDFPLLRRKLRHARGFSTKRIVCADAMAAFYDILELDAEKTTYTERVVRRTFPWPDYIAERKSFRLEDVYQRERGFYPDLRGADLRNKAMIKIAFGMSYEFMLWVAENNCPFIQD